MFIYADGIYGTMEFLDGLFPESHRAKETSCFDPFIVDATFSAGRCFWKMANLMEMDSNVCFSMIYFLFLFMMDLSFTIFSNCALYKFYSL